MKTKEIKGHLHEAYVPDSYPEAEMIQRSKDYFEWIDRRRTVREISDQPVPQEIIDNILKTASTAPSGAHKQPWTFCVVSNPEIKSKIREAAEEEERESYANRMSDRWLDDLKPIGTDDVKPFLESAPYLIIVFKRVFERDEEGKKHNNYYVNESVGIACGFLISAIHNAGLVTLTHTPSPMNFLQEILERPDNERAFLLLPVGYAEDEVYVPQLTRKGLDEVAVYY
ncbi:MAG: nitroreductase family protein [Reichenbachiella sp.]|uniref:nitroreductase family protein n=1 Tax=Reichenbachiella sp. TaxID=2184521 RepID=UPI002966E17B|nr:nitroreductase family protein [Reichenbachiella sp.]MDW3209940.1 nitroreductase family protein [Reichenbachiella sp.]